MPTLTSHHGLPAGLVDYALTPSDIIAMAGAPVGLYHIQMAVGVRHCQPSKHGVIGCLPQGSLVLPLNASPRLLVHVVIASPTSAIGKLQQHQGVKRLLLFSECTLEVMCLLHLWKTALLKLVAVAYQKGMPPVFLPLVNWLPAQTGCAPSS